MEKSEAKLRVELEAHHNQQELTIRFFREGKGIDYYQTLSFSKAIALATKIISACEPTRKDSIDL